MKKLFFIVASALSLASCGNTSTTNGTDAADSTACDTAKTCCEKVCCFNGDWNFVEVNGQAVAIDTTDEAATTPSLSFDVKEKIVSGSTGCNNLTGSFNCCPKSKTLDLGALGATKRMCKDMETEASVLLALSKVKHFDVTADSLYLTDSTDAVVAKLVRVK